jgi:exosortase
VLNSFLIGRSPTTSTSLKISPTAVGLLTSAFLWCFYPVLISLISRWNSDPQYSHGFIVPLFAGFIAWHRREHVSPCSTNSSFTGVALIIAGIAAYIIGTGIYFDWLVQASMLPTLWGSMWILSGKRLAWISLPGILYLLFMIPLPYSAEVAMAQPLQRVAGVVSTFLLQTIGLAAYRSGNLINVEGHVLGIAEACSGLRMLVVFFALATAVALVTERHWLQKFILVVSAVGIALFCNILRITATGALYVYAGPKLAETVFHDLAGWLMIPLALVMLWAELQYLQRLFDDSWGSRSIVNEQPVTMFAKSV